MSDLSNSDYQPRHSEKAVDDVMDLDLEDILQQEANQFSFDKYDVKEAPRAYKNSQSVHFRDVHSKGVISFE